MMCQQTRIRRNGSVAKRYAVSFPSSLVPALGHVVHCFCYHSIYTVEGVKMGDLGWSQQRCHHESRWPSTRGCPATLQSLRMCCGWQREDKDRDGLWCSERERHPQIVGIRCGFQFPRKICLLDLVVSMPHISRTTLTLVVQWAG